MRTDSSGALRLGDDYPRVSVEVRPLDLDVPWYDAPEFRALTELRRTFVNAGIPHTVARTTEAGARLAVFWTLYELGHVIDELARRTREGAPGWCAVRTSEHGPGRVVLDIAIQPIQDAPCGERGAS